MHCEGLQITVLEIRRVLAFRYKDTKIRKTIRHIAPYKSKTYQLTACIVLKVYNAIISQSKISTHQ
jgi:hypothetical protein